jgi:hypothetical protein
MEFISKYLYPQASAESTLSGFEKEFNALKYKSYPSATVANFEELIKKVSEYAEKEIFLNPSEISKKIQDRIISLNHNLSIQLSKKIKKVEDAQKKPPIISLKQKAPAPLVTLKPLLQIDIELPQDLSVDAVLLDWKVTSLINSQTLLSDSLGTYEIDRIVWGIEAILNEIDEIDEIPDSLRGLFTQKKEALFKIYMNAIRHGLTLSVENNTPFISSINSSFTYAAIENRIALFKEWENFLTEKIHNAPPDIFFLVKTTIESLEDSKAKMKASNITDTESSFCDLHSKNHLLETALLKPETLNSLKNPSYERNMIILNVFFNEIKLIENVIKKAEDNTPGFLSPLRGIYRKECIKLEENSRALTALLPQYNAIMAIGTLENDRAIAKYLQSAQDAVSPSLIDEIKKSRIQLAKRNASVDEKSNE